MTDQITIRKAMPADLETLLQFEQGIVATERPFDNTLREGTISYYDLKAMLDAPDAQVVVALHENKIIASGYALIKNAQPYLKHGSYAYLGFMYVEPAYRGRGIISKIIDALKEWTAEKNITEIRLDVYAANTNAIRAYEKLGFKSHMLEMRLDV